jgi:signal transduction histidine kinase
MVRDNGRGIAREALERVLEPGTGEGDGIGLGLANVHRRLTTFYGEGVRLKSGGFGTVVRLDVPAVQTRRLDELPRRANGEGE